MISVVVLTRNNEKSLSPCLSSLGFCDEIIIIDNYSEDATVAVSKKFTSKIFSRKLERNFSAQRNFGIEKASGDWILFVDSDEKVSAELQKEIKQAIKDERFEAYALKRCDFFLKREMKWGETLSARKEGIIRLFKKGSGTWEGMVHEIYKTERKVGKLNSFLDHHPHQTISEFLSDINFYSTVRANELHEKLIRTNIIEMMFIPPAKFIYTYFLRLGFMDGEEGFIYSFMMSFHSFLVRAKLYLLTHKKDPIS